jgi:hypothetical protein
VNAVARQRHTDGSMTRAVRRIPAAEIKKRQHQKAEQLKLELKLMADEREFGPLPEPDSQLELLPPGVDQLPADQIGEPGLPDPRSLWYSSARED